MRRYFLFALLGITVYTATGQPYNRLGNPLVTNFTPEDYDATEQTWCITQDDRGVMYFGTYDKGILEYDGKTWRKIQVPDSKPVNSMIKGDDGVIYVGTSGDFGFLEPTADGSQRFVSLSGSINDTIKQSLSHIYKTYYFKGNVLFCSCSYIFVYDKQGKLTPVYLGYQPEYANFLTFVVNDKVYIGSYLKGLRMLNSDWTLSTAPGGSSFERINIYSIVSLSPSELLLVTDSGFFVYNQKTGSSKKMEKQNNFIESMLSQSVIPYHAIKLHNGNIGVGTVQSDWLSFFELNADSSSPSTIVNPQTGLQAAQITYLYQNGESPVWATLFDGGISRIELHSPIRRFSTESGINELILDIIQFNGTLYVATINGVYYQTAAANGMSVFKPVEGINGVVWSLLKFTPPGGSPMLLAGSYVDGVFEIKGNRAISISKPLYRSFPNVQHQCLTLYQSVLHPNMLYVGGISRLTYIEWSKGEWVKTQNIALDEIRSEVWSIGEDARGNLWLGTNLKGVYMIDPHEKVYNFNSSSDFSGFKLLRIYPDGDSLYVLTPKGIFYYSYSDSTFRKCGLLGKNSLENGFSRLLKVGNEIVAACYNDSTGKYWVCTMAMDSSGEWVTNDKPFKRLPNKGADALYVDDGGVLWIGIGKELFSFNTRVKRSYNAPYHALVRSVYAKDSLLFNGSFSEVDQDGRKITLLQQPQSKIPQLKYRYNGLVFSFSSPYFEEEAELLYSHYLEGSDETTWSAWDGRTEVTYTNLSEGKYTFHVKAVNIFGEESIPATFTFVIHPPWYRTLLAYFCYFIFFIGLVWGLVRWNTRRLIAEKERLEKIVEERTAEVVAQKEEIERQKEKISIQNEEITSSIQYASRIQSALLTPSELVSRIFPEHFILYLPRDIVSGDFYYVTQVESKKICIVADCTGHGVPGGFMSMLGISFITQILSEVKDLQAADILNRLRQLVISTLHQTSDVGGSKDGMDITIYIVDEQSMTMQFAGANNPLILIRNGEVTQVKGDKMPIGIHLRGEVPFTNNVIEIQKGDVMYTFSDGYVDQFGGESGRKFMIKDFRELLLKIHTYPMAEQRQILLDTLISWQGDTPRIDDVVVMGVRIV